MIITDDNLTAITVVEVYPTATEAAATCRISKHTISPRNSPRLVLNSSNILPREMEI